MTLWELAQGWQHEYRAESSASAFHHDPDACRRCQVEQWAREKAKEWNQRARVVMTEEGARAFICVGDLGVPEEIVSRNP